MQEWKWLKNESEVRAQCVHNGTVFTIEPGETRQFIEEVADVMLEENPDAVFWDRHFAQKLETQEALGATAWVANMTGCPYYPASISVTRYDPVARKQYIEELPNPVREEQRTLRREMKGGTQIVQGKSGEEQVNLPNVVIELKGRKQLPPAHAEWFIKRASNAAVVSGSPQSPDAIRSRPPSDFEPDESWDYDDIILYCELVSSQLRRSLKTASQLKATPEFRRNKDETESAYNKRFKRLMKQATQTVLYEHLYYYLVNPRIALPTRSQFEARKKGTTSTGEKVKVTA